MSELRKICVFCGSSSGARPRYAALARALGEELARRGLELVYGGGNVGLMGELADAALAAGAPVTGVIPEVLVRRERAHRGVELVVVDSMHQRKARMAALADAFIALPGGLGTLEELFEVLTWTQLGFHAKPCGLLDDNGYFDRLLAFLEHATAEGFVRPTSHQLLLSGRTPEELLDHLAAHRPPPVEHLLEAENL
jgi:uncharacterized protein (TIGR00730 family)